MRLATEGWPASDWVATVLHTTLLQDGRRLMEVLLNDPPRSCQTTPDAPRLMVLTRIPK
jgi:hypothetical protein